MFSYTVEEGEPAFVTGKKAEDSLHDQPQLMDFRKNFFAAVRESNLRFETVAAVEGGSGGGDGGGKSDDSDASTIHELLGFKMIEGLGQYLDPDVALPSGMVESEQDGVKGVRLNGHFYRFAQFCAVLGCLGTGTGWLIRIGPISDAGFKSVSDQCRMSDLRSPCQCHSVACRNCGAHVTVSCQMHSHVGSAECHCGCAVWTE